MSESTYTFLLAGKTGVGKSALGNAILGENWFESRYSSESVTDNISVKSKERNGYYITVVDTPGFMGTKLTSEESILHACDDMKKAMRECPSNGKLAVIFVIKFGERLTQENKTTLYILENIFGKTNIWKSCIIVMTFGDLFDLEFKDTFFRIFLEEQTDEFGQLFKKCSYNSVLFHNKSKKCEQKEFEMLMNCVKHLDQGYTRSKFEEAIKEQNRLLLEARLPILKVEFLKSIQFLPNNINAIQFSPVSSGRLEAVEQFIFYNLARVSAYDTPELIYYKENEPRLLEDIRSSFQNMLHLINQKKEDFRQMKIAHDIQIVIEEIKTGIMRTDPTHKGIFDLISQFEDAINHSTTTLKTTNLRFAFADSLNKFLTGTRQELENLKMRAQQAEEAEINEKKEDIIQRLSNVSTEDTDATERLNKLKNDTDNLKRSLGKEHLLISKRSAKVIKSSLATILCEIQNKEETVRQIKIVIILKIKIEGVKKDIRMIDSKNEDIHTFISNVDETIKSLKTSLKDEQLRTEFRESLRLAIREVQQQLEILNNLVRERKETEIKTLLKSITDKVYKTHYEDGECLNILSEARADKKSLLYKLDQERNEISNDCLMTSTIELNEIEKEIEIKMQSAQQSILNDRLLFKINCVSKEISEINPSYESSSDALSKVRSDISQLHKEIEESNVGEMFLKRLNEALRVAEKNIILVTNVIQKLRNVKIYSKIEEIKLSICQIDVSSESCEQEMNQIKTRLSELESEINQEELNEDVQEFLKSTLKSMYKDVDVKNEIAKETAISRNILKEIQNVIIQITETGINKENIFAIYLDFEEKILALEKVIDMKKFGNAIKENLCSAIFNAKEILSVRKEKIVTEIESEISNIISIIVDLNPNDLNILITKSMTEERLMQLKSITGETFKEKYEECEKNLTLLNTRIISFEAVKKDIDSLVIDIQNLGIPCRDYHFTNFETKVEKITEKLRETVLNKNDLNILLKRLDILNVEIKVKSNRNTKKKFGWVCQFVPLLGPIIEEIVTAGIDKNERKQLLNLSK